MILNLNPSDDGHDAVADYKLKTMALLTYDEMSLLYMANSRTLLYRHPLSTDTLLLQTVLFVPGESAYIFSKFNKLNMDTSQCGQQTLISCPVNKFSYM